MNKDRSLFFIHPLSFILQIGSLPLMTDPTTCAFSEADRAAVYRAILTRRDVRSQFRPDPLPDDVLLRILTAAHHAPSVGFSQPWDFVVIDRGDIRRAVKALFERE